MGVPYNDTRAAVLDGHLRVRHSNAWQFVEDVRVNDNGTWRDVKEVYVRHSGSWRLAHEGEHFLFNHVLSSNSQSEFSLSSWISGEGYSGNKIKGVLVVNNTQQRVNLGSFSSDSKVYLRIGNNKRISGSGGDGGNSGQNNAANGQNGQRGLYTATPFFLDNGGVLAGGGGGGAGGRNGSITQQVAINEPCMKGNQCQNFTNVTTNHGGGGGGGGAGYPGGSGGTSQKQAGGGQNGQNGQTNGGGSGGGSGAGTARNGGGGGDLGQNGSNAQNNQGGTRGERGDYCQGWNQRISSVGDGTGDTRGTTQNT